MLSKVLDLGCPRPMQHTPVPSHTTAGAMMRSAVVGHAEDGPVSPRSNCSDSQWCLLSPGLKEPGVSAGGSGSGEWLFVEVHSTAYCQDSQSCLGLSSGTALAQWLSESSTPCWLARSAIKAKRSVSRMQGLGTLQGPEHWAAFPVLTWALPRAG